MLNIINITNGGNNIMNVLLMKSNDIDPTMMGGLVGFSAASEEFVRRLLPH